jgi:hypothetical protein
MTPSCFVYSLDSSLPDGSILLTGEAAASEQMVTAVTAGGSLET